MKKITWTSYIANFGEYTLGQKILVYNRYPEYTDISLVFMLIWFLIALLRWHSAWGKFKCSRQGQHSVLHGAVQCLLFLLTCTCLTNYYLSFCTMSARKTWWPPEPAIQCTGRTAEPCQGSKRFEAGTVHYIFFPSWVSLSITLIWFPRARIEALAIDPAKSFKTST